MHKKKKIKPEWIAIISLSVLLIIVSIVLLIRTGNSGANESDNIKIDQKDIVLQDYIELEKAYDKALSEIEVAMEESPDMSLAILQDNLTGILEELKKEKELMIEKHQSGVENDSLFNPDNAQQYKDMLNMSKDVLVQRLAEAEAKNRDLEELNQDLESNNQKLKKNLEEANKYFEKEKKKNAKLNEKLVVVAEQIDELEKSGSQSASQIQILKREKEEYEERLKESNDLLEFQNYQIKELGEILRKVNVDCYFIYEQGNVEEEAKIYLTGDGISERYLRYFLRVKPNILIDFIINKEVFADGVEKVELSVYNSNNIEIYNIPKSISEERFHIVIPNKNFTTGTYYVKLTAGSEDLIIGGQYKFKIGI